MVCEFITGGGLGAERIPDSLVQEGLLMRDALLHDLSELKQFDLITMHDARLTSSGLAKNSIVVEAGQFKEKFKLALNEVDMVWLIAPESDGALLALSELCYAAESCNNRVLFLGSGFDTMLIGTSKTLCCEALQKANIDTLLTHAGKDLMRQDYYENLLKLNVDKWVAKPEDGAGCEGIQKFDSLQELKGWIAQENRYLRYLAQAYQQGVAASFSMLCRNGKAWLLSCNQQHIECHDGHFKLKGVTVNGMLPYWQRFETIARKVAEMLPDALGYVGVDVIVDKENNKIYVLEINPRLTTSYAGLYEALDSNPAKLILDCVLHDNFEAPNSLKKNEIKVNV